METKVQVALIHTATILMFDTLVGKNDHKPDAKVAGVAWAEACRHLFELNPAGVDMDKTIPVIQLMTKGMLVEYPSITHDEMRAAADAYIAAQVAKELAHESNSVS